MTSTNPFEKLSIKQEVDDDDPEEFKEVKSKAQNVPFGIEPKKKKARPQEKQVVEEEGFEEVVKHKQPKKKGDDDEEEENPEHKQRKGINYNTAEMRDYRESQRKQRGGGRQFDRKSGTGRGKEIAKGGAGGKGTWGENPKNIARDFEKNYDDYYFESVLNPKEKKENDEKRVKRERRPKKEKNEGEGEEKEKNGEEGEEEKKEDGEEGGEKKEQKPKKEKKQREKKVLKPEEKLDRPEGAVSVEDYLKSKEKPKEEEKEVKRIQDGEALKKVEEKKDDVLGTTEDGKKKNKKKKDKGKKINQAEIDLNNQVFSNLQVEEGNERKPRGDFRGKRGGRRGGKGGAGEFHYDPKDFPEMK